MAKEDVENLVNYQSWRVPNVNDNAESIPKQSRINDSNYNIFDLLSELNNAIEKQVQEIIWNCQNWVQTFLMKTSWIILKIMRFSTWRKNIFQFQEVQCMLKDYF